MSAPINPDKRILSMKCWPLCSAVVPAPVDSNKLELTESLLLADVEDIIAKMS
jgi:hypothetical protein